MVEKFSLWTHWDDRSSLKGINLPGVYIIALADKNISGTPFTYIPDIIYIGMSNSLGGLKSRLKQFDNTIKGKEGHGGARRVRYKHTDYETLTHRLYVAVYPRKCSVRTMSHSSLRIMGSVAKHEYDCLASFVDQFGQLPEFNDKKRSPKK